MAGFAEELVTGLSRVSWEKVDVSFHDSWRKFEAHSVIQVIMVSFHPSLCLRSCIWQHHALGTVIAV